MKSYKLIYQLINLVEQLEEENLGCEPSLEDFTGFLLSKAIEPNHTVNESESRFGKDNPDAVKRAYQLESNIGRHFVHMSRYAKSYIKKALAGTPLQTSEDFTALAILLTHNHLSKSELISLNLQEKASGTEVLKRLISAGLVIQKDNAEDKRSKNVSITNPGKELLYSVFADMNYVGKMITGRLTVAEKYMLQYLLQKLEEFHLEHYNKKSISNKSDIKAAVEAIRHDL